MKKFTSFCKDVKDLYDKISFYQLAAVLPRTTALLLFILLSVSAFGSSKTFGQNLREIPIHLNLSQNKSLKAVLNQIQERTGLNLFYSNRHVEAVETRIPDNYQGNVFDLLTQVLKDTGLTFKQEADDLLTIPVSQTGNPVAGMQQRQISGTVYASDGSRLSNVTVTVKDDARKSTATNADGEFLLHVSKADQSLLVSMIGYISQQVPITPATDYTIILEDSISSLEEVVVVGYGTQKKAVVTGSVAQVEGDQIKQAPVTNVTNALIGRLPGLRATQRSGQPGADGSGIDIRGFGSALVIVDGVPGSFSQLDPNAIESISIVEDASASVFGVRAANGVILVTTKRGKAGKPSTNYSTYYGYQTINRFPELGDAALYAELSNEAMMNA